MTRPASRPPAATAPATPTTTAAAPTMAIPQLRRVRWAVRATLTLGVAASVAANILHAKPNPVSQVIAAWPPLALLLTVELISRVPVYRRWLGVVRLAATAAIAGIAAWVSYWHMAGVAAHYGEHGASAYLLPISVDGLVIVASVSLVELAGRIRATTPAEDSAWAPAAAPTGADPTDWPPPASHGAPPSTGTAPVDPLVQPPGPTPAEPDTRRKPTAAALTTNSRPPQTHVHDDEPRPGTGDLRADEAAEPMNRDAAQHAPQAGPSTRPFERVHTDAATLVDKPANGGRRGNAPRPGHKQPSTMDGAVPSETAAAVAYWYQQDPKMHPADIAAKISRSERTVRRYWPPRTQASPANYADAADLADAATSR